MDTNSSNVGKILDFVEVIITDDEGNKLLDTESGNIWTKTPNLMLSYFSDWKKEETKKNIISILGWRDYGGKHYESIYTRFYQGYVLIKKYGKDKRKAHLSNLICSGQISRDEALLELEKPAYDTEIFKNDYQFFLKKMNFSEAEFESIMMSKPVSHLEYKSYETGLYRKHESVMLALKPMTRVLKKLLR